MIMDCKHCTKYDNGMCKEQNCKCYVAKRTCYNSKNIKNTKLRKCSYYNGKHCKANNGLYNDYPKEYLKSSKIKITNIKDLS